MVTVTMGTEYDSHKTSMIRQRASDIDDVEEQQRQQEHRGSNNTIETIID